MEDYKIAKDSKKKPARNLLNIPFPECGNKCLLIEYLGVCECESACPEKFTKDGDPISVKFISEMIKTESNKQ